jgi:hypothetical protein
MTTAGHPSFIETLPRRGYRFIAPVNSIASIELVAPQPDARQRDRTSVGAAADAAPANPPSVDRRGCCPRGGGRAGGAVRALAPAGRARGRCLWRTTCT